jgi:ribosomal-protein-alanine N-acetyltransferase
MLRNESIRLRPIQEKDLQVLYASLNDLDHRGSYFPIGLLSETKFRHDFNEHGFWERDEGMLLIVTPDDQIVGEIEFFLISHYLVGYELSYLIFGSGHAGKGYATDAVRLLTEYLFARGRINRLQLNIHPQNEASRRVATKAGYTLEGVMRGCWFHGGRYHDLEVWSILHDEVQPSASGN